jgi:uncharacterized protein
METNQRTITVSGHGEVSTPPDLGHLRLGVRVTNRDTEWALRASNERITAVQQALQDAGIAEDDITLGWFSISTVYDHVDGRRTFRGYQVSHDLSIIVREIERTGELLSIAVRAGADDVNGVSFRVENPSPAIDRARERAYDNARHKADELARLAGATLGAVFSIRETSHEPVEVEQHELRSMVASYKTMDAPPDVSINPDDAEFSVYMEIVWEIE